MAQPGVPLYKCDIDGNKKAGDALALVFHSRNIFTFKITDNFVELIQ